MQAIVPNFPKLIHALALILFTNIIIIGKREETSKASQKDPFHNNLVQHPQGKCSTTVGHVG